MRTKLFICIPSQAWTWTSPMVSSDRILQRPQDFLRHGVTEYRKQWMNHTLFWFNQLVFFGRPCAHYRLIDYKRGGSGFKKLCLAIPYNASARACRRRRLRFPPPSASASTLSFPFPSHVAPSKMGDGTTFCVLSNLRAR